MELAGGHGLNNFSFEHQVLNIGFGNHHPLMAPKTLGFAYFEKPFDLFVHAADGLNFTFLVDRTGNGNALTNPNARKTGQYGIEFGG